MDKLGLVLGPGSWLEVILPRLELHSDITWIFFPLGSYYFRQYVVSGSHLHFRVLYVLFVAKRPI